MKNALQLIWTKRVIKTSLTLLILMAFTSTSYGQSPVTIPASLIDQATANTIQGYLNNGVSVVVESSGELRTVNGVTIAKTSGGDATLTFKSALHIYLLANLKISSVTGKLNLVFWSNTNGTGGIVRFGHGTDVADIEVKTNGGHVWVGGGSGSATWNGLSVGNSYALGGIAASGGIPWWGLEIYANTQIFTDGGHVSINGTSQSQPTTVGVRLVNSLINSGSGNIDVKTDVTGITGSSTDAFGLWIEGDGGFSSTSGNITFNNVIRGSASISRGLLLQRTANGFPVIASTQGNVSITNDLSAATSANKWFIDIDELILTREKVQTATNFTEALPAILSGSTSTYSSSATSVATVNNQGLVSIVGLGNSDITGVFTKNDWNSIDSRWRYKIGVVNKADPDITFTQAEVFKQSTDPNFILTATQQNQGGGTLGAISYASSNRSVATVNATTGEVTIVGEGSTVISATSTSTVTYAQGNASYNLYVTSGLVVFTTNVINNNSIVTVSGNVVSDGGNTVTERGFVYATTSNPTISDYKVVVGTGTGTFSGNTPSLASGTYYFRAFATNSTGTVYGSEFSLAVTPIDLSTLGCITIVASDGATEGTTWTYSNGTIMPNSTTNVNIDASAVLAKLALEDLTIAGKCITVDADLNYSADANSIRLKASGNIVQNASKSITTSGGDVIFWADSDDNGSGGIQLKNSGTNGGSITTNGGAIIMGGGTDPLTGFAKANNGLTIIDSQPYGGLWLRYASLNAGGGNITLNGSNGSLVASTRGLYAVESTIQTSGSGTISLNGDGGSSTGATNPWGINTAATTIQTDSGDIHIYGISNRNNAGNERGMALGGFIQSVSGDIFIEDRTTSATQSNYNANFNGIYMPVSIGKGTLASSSSNVYIKSNEIQTESTTVINTSGVVEVIPYTGETTFTNAFIWSGSLNSSNITIGNTSNTSNISLNSPISISGSISVYGGAIDVNANITATGGSILLDADLGTALPTNDDGVYLGNNVELKTITSGDITIYGRSGNNSAKELIGIQTSTTPNKIISAGSINMTGISAGTSTNSTRGTWFHSTEIAAAGVINVSGRANPGNGIDVSFQNSTITTTNGAISIKAQNLGYVTFQNTTVQANNGQNITVYTGNIWFGGSLQTTGQVAILPAYNSIDEAQLSFTSAINTNTYTFDTSITSLTIGGTTNTQNITIGSAMTIAGPITIYGGDIAINGSMTATNDNINLYSNGNVTQTAAITANGLGLNGTGNFTLTNASNNVTTIAGGDNSTRLGSLRFTDATGGLTVGSVNPTGINSSGAIEIATISGDLLVTEPIVSSLSTGDAVKLYADKDAAAGELGDGQIKMSLNGVVTVESGARALLYSGKELESTGVKTALGGEANIRYEVDANTNLSTIDPAISATGSFGLFRIDNLIDLTVTSQNLVVTKLYDGTNTTSVTNVIVSGVESGDDVSVSAIATYNNANVGSNKAINVIYALGGSDGDPRTSLGTLTPGGSSESDDKTYANISRWAQQFVATESGPISKIKLNLYRRNAQSGIFTVQLWSGSGSTPSVSLTTLKTLDWSSIPLNNSSTNTNTFVEFDTFDNSYSLISGNTYWIVVSQTSNGPQAKRWAAAGGGNQIASYSTNTSSWTNQGSSINLGYQIEVSKPSKYRVPSNFTTNTGEITQKAIEITAASDIKVFDGVALTKNNSSISGGSLVNSQTYTVTLTGSQTNVGSSTNVASNAVIKDSSDNDVTANYNITYVNGSLEVTKLDITIIPTASQSKTYGEANTPLTYTISPSTLPNGTAITLGGTLSRTLGENVGTYSITLGTVSNTNYNITLSPEIFAINKKTITVSGITAGDKVYDANTNASVDLSGITFTGKETGDTITATVTGTFDTKDIGTAKTVSLSATYSSSALDNYTIVDQSSTTSSITAKTVSVTGNTGINKTYDGNTNLPLGEIGYGSLTGVIGSEDVTLSGVGVYDAASVGSRTIAIGTVTLTGADKGNYSLLWTNGSGTISKKTLTVTANNDAKFVTEADTPTYNGVSYSGFEGSDSVADITTTGLVISRTASNTNITAGSYPSTLVPSGLPDATNYDFNYVAGDYTIVAADKLLLNIENITTTYGSSATYTVTSAQYYKSSTSTVVTLVNPNVNGDGIYPLNDGSGVTIGLSISPSSPITTSAGKLAVGNYPLTASVVSGTSVNFNNVIEVVGNHSVTKKGLTASASSVSKEYDATTAMSGVSLGLTGLESSDAVTVNGTGAFSSPSAGTGLSYTIAGLSLAGADADNYYLSAGASFSGTNGVITKAPLTVTANNDNGVDTDPAYSGGNGVTYTGFKGLDGVSDLGGTLSYTGTSQGATSAGTYTIVPGGLTSSNYSITFVAGTLTIIVGDSDGDGVRDPSDNCPTTPNADQADADGDGVGDVCDNAPNTPNADQADSDGDGIPNVEDDDDDNDGVPDSQDAFPTDPNETTDSDGDGQGDNIDIDLDNDGVLNSVDNCPSTANSDQLDTDADGTGNSCDNDDDNDGYSDADEIACGSDPLLASSTPLDTDADGIPNCLDEDDDNDGYTDVDEVSCGSDPLDASNVSADKDQDGIPDCIDEDIDNDGVLNTEDAFPLDPSEWLDTDKDGIGNNADEDDDNDGQSDTDEIACGSDPLDNSSLSLDYDQDGIPNCVDEDSDNDGVLNTADAFPLDPAEWIDTDADGIGNNADEDDDNDGYSDLDELECNSNPLDVDDLPGDLDQDGIPDCLDNDIDGDGCINTEDVFPRDPSECTDADGDGLGDNIDIDSDNDGVPNSQDAFPLDPSETKDSDGDGIGDNADTDDNNDGFDDAKLEVSGVLTPNSSGLEATWKIINLDMYPSARVSVYNKNGQEVFSAQGYRNDWRGTYKNSADPLPAASYYYVIELNTGEEPITGWLYITY